MKFTYRTMIVAFAGLMSALLLGLNANAECGWFHKSALSSNSRFGMVQPQLLRAALDADATASDDGSTMVGLWKEHWISKGSEGIPDGTEVDAGYSQWHSDGTETNVSGLRAPMTGDVCLGVWEKISPHHYRLNHFGISYDPSGLNLVGLAVIRQTLEINPAGNTIHGTFTIDQYDESGNLLAHVQGTISGTRVNIHTGWSKVE